MKTRRREAATLTLLSFLVWSTWSLGRPSTHPFGDLSRGQYTDHFSHLSTARLFWRVGTDIWRRTFRENTRPLTGEELRALPPDVAASAVPLDAVWGWRHGHSGRPLVATWPDVPRFYPPGDELLFSPAAWAFEHSDMSFTRSNRVLLLLLLLYAHLSLFFFVEEWLEPGRSLGLLGWVGAAWTYSELIHWTLEGFYDAAYLAPLVLTFRFLRRGRPLAALLCYAVAGFIHFRAYFYAPLALVALGQLWQARAWQRWRVREWTALALAGALGAASLGSFALCWPRLQQIVPRNAVYLARAEGQHLPLMACGFALAVAMVAILFWRRGRRLDASVLGWMTWMFLRLPAAYRWYDLVPLPWLASRDANGRGPPWRTAFQLGYTAFVAVVVCQARLGPVWLKDLF